MQTPVTLPDPIKFLATLGLAEELLSFMELDQDR
jgi:hypothetical protein